MITLRRSPESGFTLVEVLMALLVTTVGTLSVAALMAYGTRLQSTSPLAADPDGNGAWDSIRVQADWNPADGDLADPYEDMTFTVVNGQLFKEEPADGGTPVLFADNVQSLAFAYRDTNNNAIANPVTAAGAIAFVTITVNTRATQFVQDGPALALRTSVAVRRAE